MIPRLCIPSYNRPADILIKTLDFLRRAEYPRDKIHIFVASEEERIRYEGCSAYNIVVGVPGLVAQRKFISDWLEEDEIYVSLDDDVTGIKGKPLLQIVQDAVTLLETRRAGLFGIMPKDDARCFKEDTTSHLSFIVGAFFICRNHKSIVMGLSETEDYERSILYFKRYGAVFRYRGAGVQTKYLGTSGGSDGVLERKRAAVEALVAKYPEFCSVRNKDGQPDILLNWRAKCPTEADFKDIIAEMRRRRLYVNRYRKIVGEGRSQTFGVVSRRCLPQDYSRQCWTRPYLYKLLLDFGKKFVSHIPWTSITVNDNYKASPHYDTGNIGESYLIGFGDYTGGSLRCHNTDLSGCHDVKYKPLLTDFSKVLHSVEDWEGERFSLVFYTITHPPLPPPSVRQEGGKWVFYRGDELCTGLPHPLRKN